MSEGYRITHHRIDVVSVEKVGSEPTETQASSSHIDNLRKRYERGKDSSCFVKFALGTMLKRRGLLEE